MILRSNKNRVGMKNNLSIAQHNLIRVHFNSYFTILIIEDSSPSTKAINLALSLIPVHNELAPNYVVPESLGLYMMSF